MGSAPGILEAPRAEGPSPGASTNVVAPRPGRRPVGLAVVSGVVAVLLLLPLAFLVLEAVQYGWSAVAPLLFRQLTATLLWNTVSLLVVVTAACAVLGTLAAWCVERTDLPGRRLWAVLVVVPVGIPDFAVSFGWKSLFVGLGGFAGSVLVMTLAVYPLVYLPVAASLRNADPGQEEVARSLGVGRVAHLLAGHPGAGPTGRPGRLRAGGPGGPLAEYGAFEILGYRTFTTEIFTEAQVGFDAPAACALSLVLVLLGLVVLSAEGVSPGGEVAPAGWGRWPPAPPSPTAWAGPRSRCWPASPCWWPLPWGCPSGPSSTGCSSSGDIDAAGRRLGRLGRRAHRRSTAPGPGCWPRWRPCRWRSCRCATPAGSPWPSSAAPTSCWPSPGS